MSEIKRMLIAEFRQIGLLQEINRRFLHPMGLALEVIIDKENNSEHFGGIWDYRDDPEGMHYGNFPEKQNIDNAKRCEKLLIEKQTIRMKRFGWHIQPCENLEAK